MLIVCKESKRMVDFGGTNRHEWSPMIPISNSQWNQYINTFWILEASSIRTFRMREFTNFSEEKKTNFTQILVEERIISLLPT